MKPISKEQEIVLNLLEKGNVIVDAVAGSGKTTTCLYIAKKFTNKNILLLTYNARLKLETRERIIINNITNMEAHSYHSFCVKYYNKLCFTDKMIKKIIDNGATQLSNYNYDLIIMDEAQDINPLFYALLKKIFKENTAAVAQECVLGDSRQSIYGYNGADSRYLTLANKVLKFNNLSWHFCNLSESFRVSLPICKFINNCMYGKEIMLSKKKGNAPKYIICDTFVYPFVILKALLKKYSPGEIFIIAPSVRYLGGNYISPVVHLENKIKRTFDDNVLIYVPNNDDERISGEIIKDKLLISSFHQVKGLERKAVVVFSFDDSYFRYYGRDKNKNKCPNEIYVASTRATEVVVLLHSNRLDYLPFLKKASLIKKYTKFYEERSLRLKDNFVFGKNSYNVCMLVRHLNIYQIEKALSFFKIKKINAPVANINIPDIETFKNSCEEVSNINGIAVPLFYEYKTKGDISLLSGDFKLPDIKKRINNIRESIKNKDLKIADVLYIANCWSSFIGGYVFKTYQIKKYDWISQETMDALMKNLYNLNMSNNILFEQKTKNKILQGVIDCIDCKNKIVYEFKCVQELQDEHYIQLACYAFLYNRQDYKYMLFNIRTGELNEIIFEQKQLEKMVGFLYDIKCTEKKEISDEEFLKQNVPPPPQL